MKSSDSIRKLAAAAAVGAIYAALTMVLAPLSYGQLQFRLSEALCILPFFFPYSALGLFCGCAIANLLSPVGLLDIIFGSLSTLGAGLCIAALGKRYRDGDGAGWGRCIAACAMPVVFNGPVIGAISAFSLTGAIDSVFWADFAVMGGEVALGEAGVMFILGLPLIRMIMSNSTLNALVEKLK